MPPEGTTTTETGTLPEKGQSSSEAPKMVSLEDHEKAIAAERARQSTLDKRLATLEKERAADREAREVAEKRAQGLEQAREQAEVDRIKDDPDQMAVWNREKRARERERAADERERQLKAHELEHDERIKKAEARERSDAIAEIAAEYSIEAGKLKDLGLDVETTRKVAATWGTKKVAESQAQQQTLKTDSGSTSGGTGKLTNEQIEAMPTEEYAKHPSVKARYK